MSLALFDLDETLIKGDCSSLWSSFMVEHGWVRDPRAFLQRDAELMDDYAQGKMDMPGYMQLTLAPLKGRSQEDVSNMVERYITEIIAPRIYADAKACIAMHRARGDRLLVISASGEHLVAPIARYLGIEESLAIGVELNNAIYTGSTQGVMTYREGKLTRLMAKLDHDASLLQSASFYSDSYNDLPLLSQVGCPCAVNPDISLLQHAQRAGWPVYRWG
ncbi:HAD family hydrolase [Chania multitudinisentens RB-25]|uniref:HAD family hydrolase n=1 Tax=Chania multitudinisentens RB-25 TaxID=1441930 RepID=W0L4K7_9GAMM|nr:HAD family hydrolase [Chania multitudinisentens]AHG18646.1 HAD family hydrolase [Chania multitudinisentens RB-25]